VIFGPEPIDDMPRGLSEEELDEALRLRAAKRWADDIRDALGLDDPE